jgi:exonuclease III
VRSSFERDSTVPVIDPDRSTVTAVSAGSVSYCLLNVRSLQCKFDDVIELKRDLSADVVCRVETWHDTDDVSVCRLRAHGYNVVDRPRPHVHQDLSTNHGGILVFTEAHVRLTPIVCDCPSSFELLCIRVTSGRSSDFLFVVYRPGLQPLQQRFFDDLSAVLEHAAAYSAAVHLVGDFNIRLDRLNDSFAVQFRSMLSAFGFTIASSGPMLCTAAGVL